MGLKMKEINLESFTDVDDALLWLEHEIIPFVHEGYDDIKGEITLIDSMWRVSVMTNSRQIEMDFNV